MQSRDQQVALSLIESGGFDVNQHTEDGGETMLMLAARMGNREVVDALLAKNGVDVNAMGGKFEETALLYAADLNHEPIVYALLKNDAKVYLADAQGYTALMRASIRDGGRIPVLDSSIRPCNSVRFGGKPEKEPPPRHRRLNFAIKAGYFGKLLKSSP